MTLNVLLSFAQFEREVTGERIRDKMQPQKRRAGGWGWYHWAIRERNSRNSVFLQFESHFVPRTNGINHLTSN